MSKSLWSSFVSNLDYMYKMVTYFIFAILATRHNQIVDWIPVNF